MRIRTISNSQPLAALISSMALIAGCAGSNPTIDTSPEAEVTFDGLHEVKGGRADKAWARPDADIEQYSKIKLQGVGIQYRPGGDTSRHYNPRTVGDHFELTEQQKARLIEIVSESFRKELGKSEYFTLVEESGPDVLLIKGALIDVVSFVPPDSVGNVDIYLSRVGEATLVLEIADSMTGTVLARAVDRRAAEDAARGFSESNRVMNSAEVRRMVNQWARLLRERLDDHKAPAE